MKKISYYLKRILKMDYKGMFETIAKISKRSHKSKIFIFFDMIIASFRYGAGYTDYFLFYFENLTHAQKKTFITRTINNNYVKILNDRRYYDWFWDKIKFNTKFKDLINRDFLDLETAELAEFKKFIKKHPTFIAKPIKATSGIGVAKIETTKKTNFDELYQELKLNNQKLVEAYVVQHQVMNQLCEASVNTLRIVTIRRQGKTTIVVRVIRIGNGVNAVDNFHMGGMYTVFDENGIITKPAVNREGEVFTHHPLTKTKFIGFKIPDYEAAVALAIKASERIPEVGLVGWDIAISKDGPVIIEGNELPGYDLYQSKVHLDDNGYGLKPLFDEVIFENKKN